LKFDFSAPEGWDRIVIFKVMVVEYELCNAYKILEQSRLDTEKSPFENSPRLQYIFSHQSVISGNHTVLDQFLKLDFAASGWDRIVIFQDRVVDCVICNAYKYLGTIPSGCSEIAL